MRGLWILVLQCLKKVNQNVENKKVLPLIFKCMPIRQFYSQMLHFYVFKVPVKCRYEKQFKK